MGQAPMDKQRFTSLATQHASINYADEKSAEKSTLITDALRGLIQDALVNDPYGLEELLDVEACAPWVAFTALESGNLKDPFKSKCLTEVRKVARSGGINAIGAQIWLNENGFSS